MMEASSTTFSTQRKEINEINGIGSEATEQSSMLASRNPTFREGTPLHKDNVSAVNKRRRALRHKNLFRSLVMLLLFSYFERSPPISGPFPCPTTVL